MLTFLQASVQPSYNNEWIESPIKLNTFGTKTNSDCDSWEIHHPDDYITYQNVFYAEGGRVQQVEMATSHGQLFQQGKTFANAQLSSHATDETKRLIGFWTRMEADKIISVAPVIMNKACGVELNPGFVPDYIEVDEPVVEPIETSAEVTESSSDDSNLIAWLGGGIAGVIVLFILSLAALICAVGTVTVVIAILAIIILRLRKNQIQPEKNKPVQLKSSVPEDDLDQSQLSQVQLVRTEFLNPNRSFQDRPPILSNKKPNKSHLSDFGINYDELKDVSRPTVLTLDDDAEQDPLDDPAFAEFRQYLRQSYEK